MDRKIKILNILTYSDIGGAEQHVLSMCRNYNKSRFEITICVLFSGGVVSDEIMRRGHEVIILNMANGFDLLRALRLIPIIRSRKIDIVSIHSPTPLGKLCSILSCAPIIIDTDHGTTVGSPVRRKQRVVLFNRLSTPFIDHFIAISKGMKQSLRLRERVPDKKITLIYNGVDVEAISRVSCNKKKLRESLDVPSGIPILGMVGRLAPEKQYPLLFNILSLLKKKGVEFIALIVGNGFYVSQRAYLEALVQRMNLDDQVRFLGQRNDVFELLELMDVFIFPSGGEGFSIILLEAMAKTKPIVAFDVEGVNEAVVSNQTGLLVPFGDVEEFAKKVKLLLDSPELAQRMGQSAFKRVSTMFNLRENIRKTEVLYENLLQKAGHSPSG